MLFSQGTTSEDLSVVSLMMLRTVIQTVIQTEQQQELVCVSINICLLLTTFLLTFLQLKIEMLAVEQNIGSWQTMIWKVTNVSLQLEYICYGVCWVVTIGNNWPKRQLKVWWPIEGFANLALSYMAVNKFAYWQFDIVSWQFDIITWHGLVRPRSSNFGIHMQVDNTSLYTNFYSNHQHSWPIFSWSNIRKITVST